MSGDEDPRCHVCGHPAVVEVRQLVPDDPGEPPGTVIWTCTVSRCRARTIVYSDID